MANPVDAAQASGEPESKGRFSLKRIFDLTSGIAGTAGGILLFSLLGDLNALAFVCLPLAIYHMSNVARAWKGVDTGSDSLLGKGIRGIFNIATLGTGIALLTASSSGIGAAILAVTGGTMAVTSAIDIGMGLYKIFGGKKQDAAAPPADTASQQKGPLPPSA